MKDVKDYPNPLLDKSNRHKRVEIIPLSQILFTKPWMRVRMEKLSALVRSRGSIVPIEVKVINADIRKATGTDKTYLVANGFHRCNAVNDAGYKRIPAFINGDSEASEVINDLSQIRKDEGLTQEQIYEREEAYRNKLKF